MAGLGRTIPALPVRSAAEAVTFYRDRLGFEVLHHDGGFVVIRRDDRIAEIAIFEGDQYEMDELMAGGAEPG